MAELYRPSGDHDVWGEVLNGLLLLLAHNPDAVAHPEAVSGLAGDILGLSDQLAVAGCSSTNPEFYISARHQSSFGYQRPKLPGSSMHNF